MRQDDIAIQVRALIDAYRANDLTAYFGAIADDATVLIGGKGRADKQMYERMWTSVIEAGGGVVSAEIGDLQVRTAASGDAGVATFMMEVTYRGLVPGDPAQLVERKLALTEVWFKAGDRWSVAHMDWFDQPPVA